MTIWEAAPIAGQNSAGYTPSLGASETLEAGNDVSIVDKAKVNPGAS